MSEQPPPPPPPPAPPGEPPTVETIRTMLNISKLITLILGVIGLIAGIVCIVTVIGVGFGIYLLIGGVIDLIIWKQIDEIMELVNKREYEEAKNRTLIWMILGLILGLFIPGIFLLIAYLKYDEAIRATST